MMYLSCGSWNRVVGMGPARLLSKRLIVLRLPRADQEGEAGSAPASERGACTASWGVQVIFDRGTSERFDLRLRSDNVSWGARG